MSNMNFCFEVEPKAQVRPRFSKANGFVRTYEPQEMTMWKNVIKILANVQMQEKNYTMFSQDKALTMSAMFYFAPPKSISKKKRERLIGKEVNKKPDIDNLVKALMDALTGVVYEDDSSIATINAFKKYTDKKPYIELELKEANSPIMSLIEECIERGMN